MRKYNFLYCDEADKSIIDSMNQTMTRLGGKIEEAHIPFILFYPNDKNKRYVQIQITRFYGFPHYFASIREEDNYIASKTDNTWFKPWSPDYVEEHYDFYADMIRGRYESSGEVNTMEEAEDFVEKKLIEMGIDESNYDIQFVNCTDDNFIKYSYKEGD